MNKHRTIIFLILFMLGSCLFSQMKLDVKTKFREKSNLIGIKQGVIYFLKKNGYNIVEIGEKYSLWITDFQETENEPNRFQIRLKIQLCPPALFSRKKPVASEDIEVSYNFTAKMLNVDKTGFIRFIREKFNNIKTKEIFRALHIGVEVSKTVNLMLRLLRKGGPAKI